MSDPRKNKAFDSEKTDAFVGEFFGMVADQSVQPDQPIDDSLLDSSEASDQETGGGAKGEAKRKVEVKGSSKPPEAMEVDEDDGLGGPTIVEDRFSDQLRTPNLQPYGPLFLDAAARLFDQFEEFAKVKGDPNKALIWSVGTRERRFEQVLDKTLTAFKRLIPAVFADRNIAFREGPSMEPEARPLDPEIGQKVAQKVAVMRPTNTHKCMCANMHRMIFNCQLAAADHPTLCKTVADMCRTLEGSTDPIKFRKADSSQVGTIPKKPDPSESGSKPSDSSIGVAKPDSETPEASKTQRKRKRPDRSQSRSRSRGSDKDKDQKSSEPKKKKSGKGKSKDRLKPKKPPTKDKSPKSDSSKKKSGLSSTDSKPPSASAGSPKTAQHGEKVVYKPDGTIDWRFAPLTPSDLPPDRMFSTDDRNGIWHCSVTKR